MISIKTEQISQYWVLGTVLIYSLVMAEYFNSISREIAIIQGLVNNSIYTYISSFSFIVVILSAFVVWIVSSFMFHMFAVLFGGDSSFKDFQKYSGLLYLFPAIGFLLAIFMFDSIKLPKEDITTFLKSNETIVLINQITNISSTLSFVLLIPVIKYLYNINWVKAVGSVIIPIASISLIGRFFANYIL